MKGSRMVDIPNEFCLQPRKNEVSLVFTIGQ